jgi:hypothetical protein
MNGKIVTINKMRKTMTMILDTKKLLADCVHSEEVIFDLVSFSSCSQDREAVLYQIEQIKKQINDLHEMRLSLCSNYNSVQVLQYVDKLRYMLLRLEAAVLYAKNHFNID